jgi:hypothetical protein
MQLKSQRVTESRRSKTNGNISNGHPLGFQEREKDIIVNMTVERRGGEFDEFNTADLLHIASCAYEGKPSPLHRLLMRRPGVSRSFSYSLLS